ncbi:MULTISPECIES: helix-turn-helix domain-containing protein [unclassified Microbacterium]|uniref:helix-turn-helix domain-containing protein n=1 Tax=unclassified Microbacterium TaxID=2609290 RepID=UPI00203F0078|nr:helix-turn-helix domain-containing protein [Microbacterium sp. USTB-Y]
MARAAEVIREARKRAGMTQIELARRSGIAQNVISDYERGKREPSFGAVDLLLGAAGLTIEYAPLSELERIRRRRDEIVDVLAAHGLTNVGVFGSVARGEETSTSDIDLLVDIADGTGLLAIIGAQVELEDLLGRSVDLVPRDGLKADVTPSVTRDVVML